MHATYQNNAWVEFGPDARGNVETPNGMLSAQAFASWSDEYKEALGIFAVTDDAIPEGKIVTGWTLGDLEGRPVRSFTLEDAPPPPVPDPTLYAVAQLSVENGEISGLDITSKFSAAMWFDVGLYYVFFAESLPDASYLAKAYDGLNTVRVVERATDYIVVTATDPGGDPVDPPEVSIEIIRV